MGRRPSITCRCASVAAVAMLVVVTAGCSSGSSPRSATTPSSRTATTTTPTTAPVTTAPRHPSWMPLPRPPITGRIAAGSVWTGTEVLVWGGVSAGTAVADGAAYNPSTHVWRTIAAPPPGVLGDAGNGTAWTGDHAVFWAGNSPDGPAGGGVYDPKRDTWTRLANGPLGAREGYASVWTGKELLIIGGVSGDTVASPTAAAVDPQTGQWRSLNALDAVKGLDGPAALWTGKVVLIVGTRSLCPALGSACRRSEPFFASYVPATDTLHAIDPANAPAAARRGELQPIAWSGSRALFAIDGQPQAGVLIYDPVANMWRSGRRPPCAVPDASYSQTAWIGNRYVEACGADGVQIYDPAGDTWGTRAAGPSPLNSRSGSAIVWTGTDLFAWSGTVKQPGNPTPADGATLRLAG